MISKTLFTLSFLFFSLGILQSCESKSSSAKTTTYAAMDNRQSDQSGNPKDRLKIPVPTDQLVDSFYQAIFDNDELKVKKILSTKFPADYIPKNKISPLQAVIWSSDNVELAKLFVEGNISILHKDKAPILIAAEYGRLGILNYLITQGADIKESEAFNTAGFYQKYDCAKSLLLQGANQEKGNVSGKLWMYENAVRKRDYEVLNALNLQADEWNYNNCQGETAVIIAIKQNDLKMVKYLVDKGADKNYPENFDCGDDIYQGKTPLEIAEEYQLKDIINFLKNE